MKKGINRALNNISKSLNESVKFASKNKPCVFLSHRSLDKDMVEEIGKYIMKAGLDIYLDKYDEELQRADKGKNDKLITECIQKGISESTHIMCLLSPNTINSWWVPYEIGYADKSVDIEICSLKLKELPDNSIPSYIKINKCLKGIPELNGYLIEILIRYNNTIIKSFSKYQDDQYEHFEEASIIQESYLYHPLSKYLDIES